MKHKKNQRAEWACLICVYRHTCIFLSVYVTSSCVCVCVCVCACSNRRQISEGRMMCVKHQRLFDCPHPTCLLFPRWTWGPCFFCGRVQMVKTTGGPALGASVVSPALTGSAVYLLQDHLSEDERQLWTSLGPNWTLPWSVPTLAVWRGCYWS